MRVSATAQQVAALAKVSQSAVSRTFTPGASVSEATRKKVLEAAQQLGYRPNAIARSLITRRSRIVGLVMSYLENQFYPLVIERLSQMLQQRGYHVLLFIGELDESHGVLMEILQYQVEGIVLASTMLTSELAKDCAQSGIPVVLFNRLSQLPPGNPNQVSSVTSNNYAGGKKIANRLLDAGYRKIAFLAGLENSSTNKDREKGFMETLAARGASLHSRAVGNYSFEGAQEATRLLFSSKRRPDAVFVANDHMAIAAMDVLRTELNLRIPEDVGIVGFDDVPQAAWGAYQLTTVRQSVELMVEATVDILSEQMEGQLRASRIVVPCDLVERSSLRPVSKSRTRAG
ncbi:MAG: LacI family DNA-binding transcriptional regulator [Pseudomonadota bacterium]